MIGPLLALQLAGAVMAPWGVAAASPVWDFRCSAAIGATLAPPTLLAFWAVFGPGRGAVRLPLLTWLAGAYYVALLYGECQSNGGPDDYIYLGDAPWLASFVMMLLPLWLLRATRHWRLMLVDGRSETFRPTSGGKSSGSQFTVRAVMGWTLAAAVLLAATRSLIADGATARMRLLDDADAWSMGIAQAIMHDNFLRSLCEQAIGNRGRHSVAGLRLNEDQQPNNRLQGYFQQQPQPLPQTGSGEKAVVGPDQRRNDSPVEQKRQLTLILQRLLKALPTMNPQMVGYIWGIFEMDESEIMDAIINPNDEFGWYG